jgi:hypothetical protein
MSAPVFCLAAMARIDMVKKRNSLATKESVSSITRSICQSIAQFAFAEGDLVHQCMDELR